MNTAAETPKWRLAIGIFALCVSSMCTLGDMVITPIAANLYEVFADAPEALINFGVTGPALVGLPFGLIAGWLCDRFDKKWIMVIGFAIFTFSAIFGAAITNIWYFVICRCLATGVGWGITNTTAFSILADLYPDEKKHGRMVGIYNAAMSVMGALLSVIGGVLAASGAWQDAFMIYWIAAPVLVLLVIFLPSMKPKTVNASDKTEEKAAGASEDKGWFGRILPLVIQVFFFAVLYFIALYMISVFITEAGVGDEAFVGIVAAVMTIATGVGSLCFGPLYTKMKATVYMPFQFVIGLAFVLMGYIINPAMCLIGAVMLGFAWAFYFCYFYVRVTEYVPEDRTGTATGIVAFSDGLAATGSSYLLISLMDATGMSSVQLWPLFGYAIWIILIISVIYWFVKIRKSS